MVVRLSPAKSIYFSCPERGFMIVVEHRSDRLLQRSVERGVPADSEGTFIERVTVPTHRALLAFLTNGNKPVIGEHADFENLKRVLDQWPEFAAEKGILSLDKGFAEIEIIREMNVLATEGGMGGPFVVALYQNIVG
jgi:hypothetical protein